MITERGGSTGLAGGSGRLGRMPGGMGVPATGILPGIVGVGLVVFVAAGCGRPPRVAGSVTVNGAPLPAGRVTFLCDGAGKPAISSEISPDGTYEILSPPAGRARISVQTFAPRPKPPAGVDPGTGIDYSVGWEDTGPYVPIPERYHSPQTSGLVYEIRPGDQTFDITLEKP